MSSLFNCAEIMSGRALSGGCGVRVRRAGGQRAKWSTSSFPPPSSSAAAARSPQQQRKPRLPSSMATPLASSPWSGHAFAAVQPQPVSRRYPLHPSTRLLELFSHSSPRAPESVRKKLCGRRKKRRAALRRLISSRPATKAPKSCEPPMSPARAYSKSDTSLGSGCRTTANLHAHRNQAVRLLGVGLPRACGASLGRGCKGGRVGIPESACGTMARAVEAQDLLDVRASALGHVYK
eukprot:scaffold73552_cov63-Phaeocystis_antarctica.AAC.5